MADVTLCNHRHLVDDTTMIRCFLTLLPLLLCWGHAFTIPTTSVRSSMSLNSMKDTLETIGDQVIAKFALQATDFCDTFNAKTWVSDSGVYGTSMWMSESSPNWLTGVSLCTRVNSDGTNELLTVNVWYVIPDLNS